MQTIETVSILGLGLMGGSLGLAAGRKGAARRVVGYARREETRREAVARGVVDEVFDDPCDAVREADLTIVCVPILAIGPLVLQCRDAFAPDAVITDVGSTKAHLAVELTSVLDGVGARFVGSHPVAGSEETGIEATREDLYEGAVVVVTPGSDSREADRDRVVAFWQALGSVVKVCTPEAHDSVLARTSHLPHLVAAALVGTVLEDAPERGGYCGSGFRDTTRVAGGSAEVWHDIVKTNRREILGALDEHVGRLSTLADVVRSEDLDALTEFLASASRLRLDWQKEREKNQP